MPAWFFTSDLHGQTELYEQTLREAAAGGAQAVVIGGDLGPHATGEAGMRRQRLFLEGFVVEFARRLHEAVPGVTLLLLMGNDDWAANADVLERHHDVLWQSLHGRVVRVHGLEVAGLSWVPITPFSLKDWERWEDGAEEAPARLEGWRSADGAIRSYRFDAHDRQPTIADALAALGPADVLTRCVHVLHSPPRDTACDVIGSRAHVGSRAIRAHVERVQPPLVLSGHIHEAPRVTGAWRDAIGRTCCVNPGQFGTPRLCGAWFDPADPAGTLRHTVHG